MAGKDKNIKTDLSGFLRYRGKEMPGKERNAFEKELQKDPFAEEAAEGFGEMDPEVIKNDLQNLTKQLRSRTRIRQRIIYYRIAASVAVLMIITSVLIVIQRNKPEKLISENTRVETPFEISKSPALSEPRQKENNKIALNELQGAGQKQKEEPPVTVSNEKSDNKAVVALKAEAVVNKAKEKISIPEKNEAEIMNNLVDPQSAKTRAAYDKKEDTALKAIPNPSQLALNEVVVSAYGAKRKSEKDMTGAVSTISTVKINDAGYTSPQPANGKENFDKYIKENIRRPADAKTGKEEVVVVSFTVKSTGIPENIKIIQSPGNSFSDEAIRLIKEGPAWKPAEENGIKIDDEVRIRIVFK